MKKLAIFRRFDSRLAAELRQQRKSIIKGIVCTALSSALYSSTIWLVEITTSDLTKISNNREEVIRSNAGAGHLDAIKAQVLEEQLAQARLVQGRALHNLELACLAFVLLFGLRYFFTRGQMYFLSEAANKLSSDLRVRMFNKLMRLPVSYFNDRRAGAIQSVLTNDVNVYQSAVMVIRDTIDGPIKAVVSFASLIIIQWQLAMIAIMLIPIMVVVIQRNARKMRAAQTDVQESLAEVGAVTQEAILGTRVVKAFGAESRIGRMYADLVSKSYRSQMRAVYITASLRPLVELIGASALALLLVIGGYIAMSGTLDAPRLIAMVVAMDAVNQGFRNLANVSNTFASVEAASARIHFEILDLPDAPDAHGTDRLDRPRGQIEFKNVSFAYPDGTEALRNVSFTLEPGTSLALVGPSGAGKSTIADLILRFYEPTEGQILFDGVDMATLDVDWLRSQIGVVPQQTFLFAGSIEDNVKLGKADATPADLNEALRMAHAQGFTSEMSGRGAGLLGERGTGLSGGQMQRVAIARALVRKPTLLLLDEATSALDATSEKVVTEALDEVMHQRTTLFIAHRLTTAARADRILVLSKGEVVEKGSHAELMEANGAYAGLFRAFSGGIVG